MICANNVTLKFGKRTLFEDVNIKFMRGYCYGIIGANGAGKSTFLKLLSGDIETTSGDINITDKERISVLKQDHFIYENNKVIDVVLMGNTKLYNLILEKDKLYSQTEFTDADYMRMGDLESLFADMNGYNAENMVQTLLCSLGIDLKYHAGLMKDLTSRDKVKVLLAQALFDNPDILLLDEPTNNLDIAAVTWLEEFLINFTGTVIVVSHDRHFLNKVCTHIVDIDYNKMKLYIGNYDFWYESSQLALKQIKEQNRKKEEKIKELQDFIARFSANASKSKQATSRKKMLNKIELEEIIPSSRKYPFIDFKIDKPSGKEILTVSNLCYSVNGEKILDNLSFTVLKADKIIFLGDDLAITTLFKIIMGQIKPTKGTITWGVTIKPSYFPQDNSSYFLTNENIIEWMSHYYTVDDETILRGFLGRMLFSGEEVFKNVKVLSGGEKARCMLSKCMLESPNFLILDQPTNHLDLESITSLNNGLEKFEGELLLSSHDHELNETVANRVIEILPKGLIDRKTSYDEYINIDKK